MDRDTHMSVVCVYIGPNHFQMPYLVHIKGLTHFLNSISLKAFICTGGFKYLNLNIEYLNI